MEAAWIDRSRKPINKVTTVLPFYQSAFGRLENLVPAAVQSQFSPIWLQLVGFGTFGANVLAHFVKGKCLDSERYIVK
jgi:hypothetical protein